MLVASLLCLSHTFAQLQVLLSTSFSGYCKQIRRKSFADNNHCDPVGKYSPPCITVFQFDEISSKVRCSLFQWTVQNSKIYYFVFEKKRNLLFYKGHMLCHYFLLFLCSLEDIVHPNAQYLHQRVSISNIELVTISLID